MIDQAAVSQLNQLRATAIASDTTLATMVRTHIVFVMGLCDGNRRKAASMLGISRSTLYRHLAEYGTEVQP